MASSPVRVKGLRELSRAFARYEDHLHDDLRGRLRDAAEPVRRDADLLATTNIRNITEPWTDMRVGVTSRLVYVAPRKRQTRVRSRKRPNLADLLMGRAMEPALDRNREQVVHDVERLLDELGREWGADG